MISTSTREYSHLLEQAHVYAAAKGWLGLSSKAVFSYRSAAIKGYITQGELEVLLKAAKQMERKRRLRYGFNHMAAELLELLLRLGGPADRARWGRVRKTDAAKIVDVFADMVLMIAGWCSKHDLDLEGAIRAKLDNNWKQLLPDTESKVEDNG